MGKYFQWGRPEKASISRALDEAVEDHYVDCPPAPYPVRTAACIADYLLLAILISNLHRLLAAAAVFIGGITAGDQHPPAWFISLLIATDFTVAYVYFIWTTYEFGGSPAKLILNLRVVDVRTGQRLEIGPLFLREWVAKPLGFAAGLIGFLFPLFRTDGRAFHDLVAGSTVKKIDEASR